MSEESEPQIELLSRRNFLRILLGTSTVMTTIGMRGLIYGEGKIRENAAQISRPTQSEYQNAVEGKIMYNQKLKEYNQCLIKDRQEGNDITHEKCSSLIPENNDRITAHLADDIIEQYNAYPKELNKRNYPFIIMSLWSVYIMILFGGTTIISGNQLWNINKDIRRLEENNRPDTPQ